MVYFRNTTLISGRTFTEFNLQVINLLPYEIMLLNLIQKQNGGLCYIMSINLNLHSMERY